MAGLVHNQQLRQPHQPLGAAQFGHQALERIQDQSFGLEQDFDEFHHDYDMERLAPNHETMGDTYSPSTLLMDRNPNKT
ncbi:unnamed protein product [Arabis nemorensis]|uniref:Uncharacterized protein n=1 Tax=Arabis nemorensis TaxID=586526 RepID=A0A565C4Y5_9BRAS|nr:unnamed protein product [Arabis nemorensis]